MTPESTPQEQDYPLSPVPMDQRKSVWSMGLVLLGFTFFTVSMVIATFDAGGPSGLLAITPTDEMSVAAAITLVFGTP